LGAITFRRELCVELASELGTEVVAELASLPPDPTLTCAWRALSLG